MRLCAVRLFRPTAHWRFNPYAVLGVPKSASPADIKSKYHELAKKHHPDRSGGDDRRFKEVSRAYELLKDGKYIPEPSASAGPRGPHPGANSNQYYQAHAWAYQTADGMGGSRGTFHQWQAGGPYNRDPRMYRQHVYATRSTRRSPPESNPLETMVITFLKMYLLFWIGAALYRVFVMPSYTRREHDMRILEQLAQQNISPPAAQTPGSTSGLVREVM